MRRKQQELPEIQALLDKGLTREEIESKEMAKAAKLLADIHVKIMGEILEHKRPQDARKVRIAVALLQTINAHVFEILTYAEITAKLRAYGLLPEREGER